MLFISSVNYFPVDCISDLPPVLTTRDSTLGLGRRTAGAGLRCLYQALLALLSIPSSLFYLLPSTLQVKL